MTGEDVVVGIVVVAVRGVGIGVDAVGGSSGDIFAVVCKTSAGAAVTGVAKRRCSTDSSGMCASSWIIVMR